MGVETVKGTQRQHTIPRARRVTPLSVISQKPLRRGLQS